jgi:hypothetical protein
VVTGRLDALPGHVPIRYGLRKIFVLAVVGRRLEPKRIPNGAVSACLPTVWRAGRRRPRGRTSGALSSIAPVGPLWPGAAASFRPPAVFVEG